MRCRYPVLLIRKTPRSLQAADVWGLLALEEAAKLSPGTGRALAKALQRNGLIELREPGRWTVTQAGRTMAAATAAHRISRTTAEKALAQLVLYGSMLRPEVDWLKRCRGCNDPSKKIDARYAP